MKTSSFAAAIIASCLFGTVNAQTLESTDFLIPYTSDGTYTWADFNGDGAYDILEADNYSGPFLQISQGDTFEPAGIDIEGVYLDERRRIINDYDGDGDLDILASKQNSLVILNYKHGSGFTVVETGITFTDPEYGDLYWLDVDGNLSPDIIHGRKIFLKSDNGYTESRFSLPETIFKMVFEDINNDGLVDITAGHGYDSWDGSDVHVILNQGEGQFKDSGIRLPASGLRATTLAVVDADADGDRDIFVNSTYGRCYIFSNALAESGAVSFTARQLTFDLSIAETFAADMNSDGLMDLVTRSTKAFAILRNTSASGLISFEPTVYELEIEGMRSLSIIDYDRDNDLDVHIKGYTYYYEADNRMFINMGTPGGSAPPVPVNLVSSKQQQAVTLKWSAEPGTLYNLEVTRNGSVYKASVTSPSGRMLKTSGNLLYASGLLTMKGLPAGSYEWRVQALDGSGRSSAFSSRNSFVIAPAPGAVTLQATDFTHVKLCWTYSDTDVTAFHIFRAEENSTATAIGQVTGTVKCFEDNNVPENQEVTYFVVAEKDGVYSANSATVTHHSSQFIEVPFGRVDPNIITARCLPADYDMDGDYDLQFVGRMYTSNNVLLRNNGDGTFSNAGANLTVNSVQFPYIGMTGPRDIDNDGDPDLVFITGESYSWQKVSVFINNNGVFTKGFESPEYLGIYQLEVEDMNNDGRVDLFFSHNVGNSSGNAKRYKLLYQGSNGTFEDSRLTFTDKESTALASFWLADMNNDGFMDILWSSEENNNLEIFASEGGTTYTRRATTLPRYISMGISDYNGDGKMDVAAMGNMGLNIHYGTGDFTFPDPKVIPVEYVSASLFIDADVDFNGWPDLVLSDGYRSQVVLNMGNGTFRRSRIELEANWGSSISVTDFENDGDIDIVKLGNDDQHQGLNNFYRNQIADLNISNQAPTAPSGLTGVHSVGRVTFTWSPSSDDHTPSTLIAYNMSLKDANGKVWLHSETDETGAFRRRFGPGNAGCRTEKIIRDLPAGIYKAKVQSIDASYNTSSWSSEFQVTINEGPGGLAVERILLNKIKLTWNGSIFSESSVIIERRTIDSSWETIAELSAGTTSYIDSDLAYNKIYQYRVFEASGELTTATSNVAEWNTVMWVAADTDKPNLYGSVDVADFSGDGRIDMLISGRMIYDGSVEQKSFATYENNGGSWTKTEITPSAVSSSGQSRFIDLNGDYMPDIFTHGYIWNSGYKSEAFLNAGNKTFTPTTNALTTGAVNLASQFDFDMDNDLDIIGVKYENNTNYKVVFENLGSGNYAVQSTTSCSQCPTDAAVADLDGDGDEDVLRGSNGYQVLLNTPDGLVPGGPSFPGYERTPIVADYTGDGLPDIVLISSSSSYSGKIYKNLGLQNGSLQFAEIAVSLSGGTTSVKAADFNHDGLTDLVTISPGATIQINKGNDMFDTYTLPSFHVSSSNTAIIDYDNDGDLDIFISGYHRDDYSSIGRKARILLNQTIVNGKGTANLAPGVPTGLASSQDSLGIHLTWSQPADDHTAHEGLTFDVVLLRDGKIITKGAHDPLTGAALRLVPGRVSRMATFNNLSIGTYEWRVQAVDGTFARSAFATGTFTFVPGPPRVRDTTIYACDRRVTLVATGMDIKWYKDKQLTQLLATGEFHPAETQTVYVTQTINGFEGIARRVQITIIDRPAVPQFTAPNPVSVCGNSTGVYLYAGGKNIRWYTDGALSDLLSSSSDVTVPGTTADYYVTQTIDGCEGTPLKVDVTKVTIDARVYHHDGKLRAVEQNGDVYYWHRNGFFYQTTTEPFVTINDTPANYTLAISKGGCWGYSSIFRFPDDVTSTEGTLEPDWLVYPNPATSEITLHLTRKGPVAISVIDIHGKTVYSDSLNNVSEETIDTSEWVRGLYLINLSDGTTVTTRRLIVF